MESTLTLKPVRPQIQAATSAPEANTSSDRPFVLANTVESTLAEVRDKHIIPVFVKDNEPLISHSDFIGVTEDLVSEVFRGEQQLKPAIRLSHPIKGRIPDAKDKPAQELLDHEKTLYYERMAFAIEIPTIHDEIDGNSLSLTVGGVKAFNLDNLSGKLGADQHFKLFIGFQNRVCTNLCISTDGYIGDLKVKNIGQLKASVKYLLEIFNASYSLHSFKEMSRYSIREDQFAHLVGKCRMYPFLPKSVQSDIPELLFGDSQIGAVVKDYYRDESFCRDEAGEINLWKLYNLFTGANKSTYIDMFLDRSVNAFQFVYRLKNALANGAKSWYLG